MNTIMRKVKSCDREWWRGTTRLAGLSLAAVVLAACLRPCIAEAEWDKGGGSDAVSADVKLRAMSMDGFSSVRADITILVTDISREANNVHLSTVVDVVHADQTHGCVHHTSACLRQSCFLWETYAWTSLPASMQSLSFSLSLSLSLRSLRA